jgi:hypothetical protein
MTERRWVIVAVALWGACARGGAVTPVPRSPAAAAVAAPAPAGAPVASSGSVLAGVDVFGSRQVAVADVLAALGIEEGAPVVWGSEEFSALLAAGQARLEEAFDLAFVGLSPVSYHAGPEAGKVYLTVDLVDRGDERRLRFAPPPTGQPPDPAGLVARWIEYEERAWALHGQGELEPAAPDACRGGFHCALGFAHPELADHEAAFIAEVPRQVAALRRVLATDAAPHRRAAAAYLLGYAPSRRAVVEALLPSIDDPVALVRNNVLRVLVMTQQGADDPILPLPPLLAALRYPETSDRNKAAYALHHLLDKAWAGKTFAHLRAQVIREVGELLVEMAAMKQPNNRDPALQILRVLSGADFGADVEAWRRWLATAR